MRAEQRSMRTTALALAYALLIAPVVPARATEDQAAIAKNLAENVLGKGTVRTSRMANDERTVVMVWESATYKPTNSLARTRDMLRIEVHLVTQGIFRVMTSVQDVQFEIVLGKRLLATGAARRAEPMVITYARDLGG